MEEIVGAYSQTLLNIMAWDTDGSGNGGQSWYNLSLGVSRNDENLVYVGGVNIWRSNNSGISWNIDASSGNGSILLHAC